jgi:hypothetical protein
VDAFEYYGSLAGIGFVIAFIFRQLCEEIIKWVTKEEDK